MTTHTYVSHIQFSAHNDAHARLISAKFRDLITDWQATADVDQDEDEPLMILPQGYAVEAVHLTDADDWAEHIDTGEDVCYMCGRAGGTDRSRCGHGSRVCPACITARHLSTYPIEEVQI